MQKNWVIGVHCSESAFNRRLLNGVLKYLEQHPELQLRAFNFISSDQVMDGAPPWLDRVDGVLGRIGNSPGIVDWLKRGRVPVVNATGDLAKERRISSVYTDTESLVTKAAEHFLRLGRRNIAYVGHRKFDISLERCAKFAAVLAGSKTALRSYQTQKWLSGTFQDFASLDDVEPKLLELLRKLAKPCAVLCINDRYALTLSRIVETLGFAIPDDVAILGIGDTEEARLVPVPISSLRTDEERIGFESAQLLHRKLLNVRSVKRIVTVPCVELLARESTIGKVRASCTDIDRAIQFIRDRACERTRVEDVANYIQLPLRTFELEFVKAKGYSLGQEIRMARLSKAQELLRTTTLNLRLIAKQVGLTDATNMNRFLLRWSNQSASDYRRAHAQQAADDASR